MGVITLRVPHDQFRSPRKKDFYSLPFMHGISCNQYSQWTVSLWIDTLSFRTRTLYVKWHRSFHQENILIRHAEIFNHGMATKVNVDTQKYSPYRSSQTYNNTGQVTTPCIIDEQTQAWLANCRCCVYSNALDIDHGRLAKTSDVTTKHTSGLMSSTQHHFGSKSVWPPSRDQK